MSSSKITAMLVNYMRHRFRSGESPLALSLNQAGHLRPDPRRDVMISGLSPEDRAVLDGILKRFPSGSDEVIGVRGVYQDAAITAALAAGMDIVLMGAGMDTACSRFHDELSQGESLMYEVDLPETQSQKLELLGTARNPKVKYLQCDFSDPEAYPFDGIRHNRAGRLFVWMGVAMYLPKEAVVAMLRGFREVMLPGDALVMDYPQPPDLSNPQIKAALEALAEKGEPVKFSAESMATLAEELGFDLAEDVGWGEFAEGMTGIPADPARARQLSFCTLMPARSAA
jgi:methyltransferase (TIGR00027 family)